MHAIQTITNKQWLSVLMLVLAAAAMSGCVVYHVERTPFSGEEYYLTPAERSRLENLAIEKGDAKAAYDLAFYYELSANDDKRAYKWFKIAKKLGYDRADDWIKTLERSVPMNKLVSDNAK